MRFVACTYEEHASEILAIFNDAIVNSTALYDYKPRAPESMVGWFKAKETGRFPVIGAVDQQGRLLGFASYGSFRAWPAYKYSIEHSVYVSRCTKSWGLRMPERSAKPDSSSGVGWIWAFGSSS